MKLLTKFCNYPIYANAKIKESVNVPVFAIPLDPRPIADEIEQCELFVYFKLLDDTSQTYMALTANILRVS